MYISMLMHVSVLYIVSISRHVCVCVCVCNILTYMHTRMISYLFIMLCKFVNKIYKILHDMRKKKCWKGEELTKKKKKNFKEHCVALAIGQGNICSFSVGTQGRKYMYDKNQM